MPIDRGAIITSQSRHTEPNPNGALGRALSGMLPTYNVRHEQTDVIAEDARLHPDVLITASDKAPVVIEAEWHPANSVEDDARSRLGLTVVDGQRSIDAAIALRYPETLRHSTDLDADIRSARFSHAVLYENGDRFPESGWLEGRCEDVADMIRLSSVPQRAIDEASDYLEMGIETAASRLNEISELRPKVANEIANLLGLSNVHQTRRMACAILANAMVFHDRVADMHPGIKNLNSVCGPEITNPQSQILDTWRQILQINYWPIFAIARDILSRMSHGDAARILRVLHATAGDVSSSGANVAHDLTGRIFQRLIADRKYLATFYTLPASAALLARLAVSKMKDVDWSDADAIGKLRIGDFACGTGALLAAVYEQIATRHENAGGKAENLHRVMMEEVLYGLDVMPSAVHITSATLSGVYPNVSFDGSRLYTLPYGRQRDGTVAIGSLELLQSSSVMSLINTTDPTLRTGSFGEETAASIVVDVPDEGFDMVIMNPPFTSNTKHYDAASGVVNAAFAAYSASGDDQQEMANRLKRLAKTTSYHGHAGLGSAFAALAAMKLRTNGVIALILPFTAINGSSWSKFRDSIASQFDDINVVSIASHRTYDTSFSSDTGIAECLLVGRKMTMNEKASKRGKFISLHQKPIRFIDAEQLNNVSSRATTRRLEEGPYGGIPIFLGNSIAGEVVDAPLDHHRTGWRMGGISDASVAQTVFALSKGHLWLPAQAQLIKIPISLLNNVGQRGHDSQLFISEAHNGPFVKISASPTSTYPSLWSHNAKKETRIVCEPDSQLMVKKGMEDRVSELWKTASRSHVSRFFRLNSQPLAVAFTEFPSIGGNTWPNVIFDDDRFDYTFTIWGNCTLGLILYWWHASRQQSGRAITTVQALETLPILDLRSLSDQQHDTAKDIFDNYRDVVLQPAYLADSDPNRATLDELVICELLGFDKAIYEGVRRLAAKWCAEPSVHGGKARPKDATLVI